MEEGLDIIIILLCLSTLKYRNQWSIIEKIISLLSLFVSTYIFLYLFFIRPCVCILLLVFVYIYWLLKCLDNLILLWTYKQIFWFKEDGNGKIETIFHRLVYSLAFFHAVVIERSHFGSQGKMTTIASLHNVVN